MHRLALLLPQAWWPTAAIVVLLLVLQAVILFYLSWRDPRVKEQVPATTAKATKDNGTCQLPCQSNMKVASGGCCDDVWLPYVAFTNLKYLPQVGACKWGGVGCLAQAVLNRVHSFGCNSAILQMQATLKCCSHATRNTNRSDNSSMSPCCCSIPEAPAACQIGVAVSRPVLPRKLCGCGWNSLTIAWGFGCMYLRLCPSAQYCGAHLHGCCC